MPGTFIGKALADGQLPSSAGDLYTVPASTVAFVKKATFTNTNAAMRSVTVYLRVNGTDDRQIAFAELEQNETLELVDMILEAADKIRAVASAATSVDYVIMGVEET